MLNSDLTKQAKKFTITGLLVTGLHILVAAGFINFVLPMPTLANGVAFVIATVFSYIVNTIWSFSSPLNRINLLRFTLVSLVGLFLAVSVSGAASITDSAIYTALGL